MPHRSFLFPSLAAGLLFQSPGLLAAENYALQTGDIVFQGTRGEQGEAVRQATRSPYTHCGVVFEDQGVLKVLEAVQPVGVTTLAEFQKRSVPGTFHARRLKTPLPPAALEAAKAWGAKQVGLDYDPHFQWSDGTLYCSELVWKIYAKAGVELCDTRRFHDYDLDAPLVKALIGRRYGTKDKLPKEEPVVAPSDLAASPLLEEVPKE